MGLTKCLTERARRHSKKMAHSRNIYHDPNAGFENVAYVYHPGLSDWELAKQFHRQWMCSSGHRANILHRENNQIGISVARNGHHFYATQKFSHTFLDYNRRELKNLQKAIIYIIAFVLILWVFFLIFLKSSFFLKGCWWCLECGET